EARLRSGDVLRPRRGSEASLCRLRERPDPEMLATADFFAREVVAVELPERQAESVHVQAAACRCVRRNDCNACDELDLHAPRLPDELSERQVATATGQSDNSGEVYVRRR